MKKIVKATIALLASIIVFVLTGCFSQESLVVKESDTYIVITVSNDQMQITDQTTLVDYMHSLKNDGQLSFEMDDGMVSSINGIDNPSDYSSCWMLYTSDTENANSAWGTIEYDQNVYGSAIFGAESLKIKDGCIYIWFFKSFKP